METSKEMFSIAMEMKYALIQWFRFDISDDEFRLKKQAILDKYKKLMGARSVGQDVLC